MRGTMPGLESLVCDVYLTDSRAEDDPLSPEDGIPTRSV